MTVRRSALIAALAVAGLGLPAEARSYDVTASCAFFGTANSIHVTGQARAISTLESRVPLYTEVACRITNVPAGGSNTLVTTTGMPGAAAVTAGSQTGWAVLPVTVCARARAIFGPVDPVEITLSEVCF